MVRDSATVLLLTFLAVVSPMPAEAAEALSVSVTDGALSLEASRVALDRVLVKISEAVHARVFIEAAVADDLANTRVDASFTRVPVTAALRRLLRGHHYVVVHSEAGVGEIRVYADGSTGYRELTSSEALAKSRPTSLPLPGWPPDDPAEVARIRLAVLESSDASARAAALDDLSTIRETGLLVRTLTQVLARERDSRVLERVFELAAQQSDRIPREALRTFAAGDADGTPRAQAVELLADQAEDDGATRALLRSLAASDVSPAVRETAAIVLRNLEGSPARPAAELVSSKVRVYSKPRGATIDGGLR